MSVDRVIRQDSACVANAGVEQAGDRRGMECYNGESDGERESVERLRNA
jgi:hypothetical protein